MKLSLLELKEGTERMNRPRRLLVAALLLAALFLLLGTGKARAAPCDVPADGQAFTCQPRAELQPFTTPAIRPGSLVTGVTYGWVEDYAHFYHEPRRGARLARTASSGFFYGPAKGEATDAEGNKWYKVWDYWLPARYYHIVEDSDFAGVEVNARPLRPFGWLLHPSAPSPAPGAEPQPGTGELPRYTFVQVYDSAVGEDRAVWYDIGEGRWVRYHTVALLKQRERPGDVGEEEYWVEVDLTQQTFAAYEGDRMVFAGLVSSGLARWPTHTGLFTVWLRYVETPMSGGTVGDDYYYIADVPHTMYFDGETALHGAFWHDDFGRPKSHGCVNMAPRTSEWVFYWSQGAPNDLRVWVHYSDYADFNHVSPAGP